MEPEQQNEKRGRKRLRNEANWKQNVRKRARSKGEAYISRRAKNVKARERKMHRCGRCVNKCNDALPDEDREEIFHNYWQLGDRQRQRDFIASHVTAMKKHRTKPDSKRKSTLHYYFTANGKRVKVCKAVFLTTLGIGEKTVYLTLDNRSGTGQAQLDKRGHHPPGIKKPDEVRQSVISHIASFPAMESHYARSNTSKRFLEKDLNIRKMHTLYCDKHPADSNDQVKNKYYRDIFNSAFNISFHKPKKDLCSFCFSFNNSSIEEKATMQDEYRSHHNRKQRVREIKLEHKTLAQADNSTVAVTFDLEQVLLSPKLDVSSLFYRRKLSTYNLTTYSLATHEVTCYMWHEGDAGRGSCEIATCIADFLKTLPDSTKRVILYSDTCSGQNRNQFFSTMCLDVLKDVQIECIDHIYMESGHSQMECDSAHSTIESAIKHQDIYSPLDYYRIVAMARRKNPFRVRIVATEEFVDFKDLAKSKMRNRSRDNNGNVVRWLKIKWMRYLKSSLDTIHFKYEYDGEFTALKVNKCVRGRPLSTEPVELLPLLSEAPSISQAKFKDLQYLCDTLAIPRAYHAFYKSLKHDGKAPDALTEPDATETADEEVVD